jgi:hypothetical protein
MRDVREWEPRECGKVRPLREAPPGCGDSSRPSADCSTVPATGVSEMSKGVSGGQQVLRFLRHTASGYAPSDPSATAPTARCAPAGGSANSPQDRATSCGAGCLSAISCGGWSDLGATATPTPKACSPGANSASRPTSVAGNQPPQSKTGWSIGRSPFPNKSPSPSETWTTNSTARRAKGRFLDACRRAGRDHGLWRISRTEY